VTAAHPAFPWLSDCSAAEGRLLLVLWGHARLDREAPVVWPSQRGLATVVGTTPSAVRRALSGLEKLGAIEFIRDRGRPVYRLVRHHGGARGELLERDTDPREVNPGSASGAVTARGEPARGELLEREVSGGELASRSKQREAVPEPPITTNEPPKISARPSVAGSWTTLVSELGHMPHPGHGGRVDWGRRAPDGFDAVLDSWPLGRIVEVMRGAHRHMADGGPLAAGDSRTWWGRKLLGSEKAFARLVEDVEHADAGQTPPSRKAPENNTLHPAYTRKDAGTWQIDTKTYR